MIGGVLLLPRTDVLAAAGVPAADGLRTVALSGDDAPDSGAGFTLRPSTAPALNDYGRTAFNARLEGPGIGSFDGQSIFSEGGAGGLRRVVRSSEPAPDAGGGVVFGFLQLPGLSNDGSTVARVVLQGAGVVPELNARAILSDRAGAGLGLLIRDGGLTPFSTDPEVFNFRNFVQDAPWVGDNGQTVFETWIYPQGNLSLDALEQAIVRADSDGTLTEIAREGDPAPGLGGSFTGFSGLTISSGGAATFVGLLDGPVGRAIFRETPDGSLQVVARQGETPPGFAPGGRLTIPLDGLASNSRGQTAFRTNVDGVPGGTGIFLDSGDGLSLIVRGNDAAYLPGFALNFVGEPLLNHAGDISFNASLAGPGVTSETDAVIVKTVAERFEIVVREGDVAPGFDTPKRFREFTDGELVMNASGQMAFLATLVGSSRFDLSTALFAQDLAGDLRLIASTGTLLDVSDDPLSPDLRLISRIAFLSGSGNDDGRPSGFNDRGEVAFYAEFANGSAGVFVSSRVAVPEPSGFAVWLMAAAFCGGRGRPRLASNGGRSRRARCPPSRCDRRATAGR